MRTLFIIVLFMLLSCGKHKTALVFEDHFNSPKLNEAFWNYELGDGCPDLCGWGNNERQNYTQHNTALVDSHLVITATKTDNSYYSARLTTKDKVEFQYGTIEVRAKLPIGQGVWPAIWMLGADLDKNNWPACGEIDIMEYVGKTPHEIHNTLHTADSYGQSKNTIITRLENIESGFHIYKAEWTAKNISFYIDDVLTYSFSPEVKNENTWPFDKPFYLILNLAIGGNFGGPEVDDNIFPQEFIIDYVKVYQ